MRLLWILVLLPLGIALTLFTCNSSASGNAYASIEPPQELNGYVNSPAELAAWQLYRDSVLFAFIQNYPQDSLSLLDSIVLQKQVKTIGHLLSFFDLSAFDGIEVRKFIETYQPKGPDALFRQASKRVNQHIKGDTMQFLVTLFGLQRIELFSAMNLITGKQLSQRDDQYMQEYMRLQYPEIFHPQLLSTMCLSLYMTELEQKHKGWEKDLTRRFDEEFQQAVTQLEEKYGS